MAWSIKEAREEELKARDTEGIVQDEDKFKSIEDTTSYGVEEWFMEKKKFLLNQINIMQKV